MSRNYYSCPNSIWGFRKVLLTIRISILISLCCILNVSASLNSLSGTSNFQQVTITGTVTDANTGEGLPGVSIVVEGTTTGVISDIKGKYKIDVPSTNAVLFFSYMGYLPEKVSIVGQTTIDVKLILDVQKLEEIVVIGYGTVKKKDLTGSVASVRGDQLKSNPVPNIAQAMQGKLAGVNIVSQDGRPDASVSIRIRGGGSISQSNEPLILVDGVTVSSLSDVPSDQVETIDVLKEASSTAIYGARGANGVILVTTKGAKEGKATVSYNGYVKFNTVPKYLDAMKPYDYLKYVWANAAANGDAYRIPFEQLYGIGSNLGNNAGGIESYRDLASDDMQKQVYNSSVSSNHNLSITGGTDKTKIYFAVNYLNEEGMKINSYAKRANVSLKINQKLFNNINVSLDTRYTDNTVKGSEGTTSGAGSLLSYSYRFRPIATANILGDVAALKTGNLEQYGKNATWDLFSPYSRISDYDPNTISRNLLNTASLNWEIFKGLTYNTDLTLSRNWGQAKTWGGAIYNNYIASATGAHLYAGNIDKYQKSDSWGMRWSNTVNYSRTITEIHKISMLLGQEVTNSGGTNMTMSATYFPANYTEENAFAQINQYDKTKGLGTFSSDVSTPVKALSFFGRANYSLLERYLLTFTFRADGSSKFSSLNRWGYFPAGAIAWRVSEEPFMKSLQWVDNLKARFSYGSVGNNAIPAGLTTQFWKAGTDIKYQYPLNHQSTSYYEYASTSMANPDLKWETTITRNAGVDFAILKSRLSGTLDLYWNTTKDLLMQTSLPGITGFTNTYKNVGQTSNKGIEFSLTGIILKNKDWNITANGNININKNRVDELAPNVTGLYGTNWASSAGYPASDYILMVGKSVGLVRGLKYTGFYTPADFTYTSGVYKLNQGVPDLGTTIVSVVHGIGATERPTGQIAYPGLPKYKDLNGDGIINDQDLCVIGDMTPFHTGGFSLNVTYKNIDFGANFSWSYGNQVYNVNKLATTYGPKEAGVYENKLAIMNNAYKIYDVVDGQLVRLTTPDQLDAANVNAALPLAYNESISTSTLAIEDGSYLRLNTLTLGYSLPMGLLKKAKISSFRIYGSIYNALTITGYSGLDPEVNTNSAANSTLSYPTTGMDWGTYPRARSFAIGLNLVF